MAVRMHIIFLLRFAPFRTQENNGHVSLIKSLFEIVRKDILNSKKTIERLCQGGKKQDE